MNFMHCDHLTPDEANLRVDVFVVEQKFSVEFDEIDEPNRAEHFVFRDESGNCVAVCRTYTEGDPDEWHIGRIAVAKSLRGKGFGREILAAAESFCRDRGAKRVALSAQVRASAFYEKCGYVAEGEVYFDEYCEHIRMVKTLN